MEQPVGQVGHAAIVGINVNEEVFTAEEIQFLRLATAALEWMGRQEMQEEDHTETAEMVVNNAPVVIRKLNRLLNEEDVEFALNYCEVCQDWYPMGNHRH